MTRTGFALQLLCEAVVARSRATFWTFTFPEMTSPKVGARMWSALSRDIVRRLSIWGVRVFELHEAGGLHVHLLVHDRMPIGVVRYLAEKHGFGRINVDKCYRGKLPQYLTKYLQKQARDSSLYGKRLWAAVGRWPVERAYVRDIKIESSWTDTVEFVRKDDPSLRGRLLFEAANRWGAKVWTNPDWRTAHSVPVN